MTTNNPESNRQAGYLSGVLKTSLVTSIVTYVIYGVIRRVVKNEDLYLIPLILYLVNLIALSVMFYRIRKNKLSASKKEFRNLIILITLNVIGFCLMASYYICRTS